jgi:FtsP/CotA-like multicopper oxidase with cupredoxin domain
LRARQRYWVGLRRRQRRPTLPPGRQPARAGFNEWTIDGTAFSMQSMAPLFHLRGGRRYRLRMRNASDDIHPVHLHRHSFELTRIAGRGTSGIMALFDYG